jgi:sulfate permease, SulP family
VSSCADSMLAALVAPIAVGDSTQYVVLASGAAIVAGTIFLVGGLLKLGAVSEFISKPVLKGFVFRLALTIMAKRAHKLTGISAGQGKFFHLVWHVIPSLKEANLWACAVGAIAIAVMFLLGAFAPRVPSALVVMVLCVLSVSWFGLQQYDVEVVGTIKPECPR